MTNESVTVLLIEDNPGDARLVQELVREIHDPKINLLVADTLSKGLKYIAAELIHVILLDLNLPDSQGIKTFQTTNRFAMNVPIIIYSVLSDKELIYHAMKEGARDYLIKGKIENEALTRTIRYAIWSCYHAAS